jgi:hypothetical protein
VTASPPRDDPEVGGAPSASRSTTTPSTRTFEAAPTSTTSTSTGAPSIDTCSAPLGSSLTSTSTGEPEPNVTV